jgi:hypothetical protein
MNVAELGLFPAGSGEYIHQRETVDPRGHPVPEIDCLLDRHRPKLSIGDSRPMDSCVDQHGSSDRHDRLDGSLGNSIVMMGANASELSGLFKLGKMISEGFGCKGRTIVEEVLLWHDSDVSRAQFEALLGSESLMGVEMRLKLDLDVARGRVDKDAATRVHVLGFCLATATEESTLCRADEVVDRDALAWEDLILPKYIRAVKQAR